MVEWPSEDSVTAPARWQYLAGWGKVLRHAVHTVNQHPIYGAVSPIDHESRNQVGEMGEALNKNVMDYALLR